MLLTENPQACKSISGGDAHVIHTSHGVSGDFCSYCGHWIVGAVHLDHVHPRSLGGPDDVSNIVPACASCNLSKSNKPLLLWLLERRNECGHHATNVFPDNRLSRRHISVLFGIFLLRGSNGVATASPSRLSSLTGYTEKGISKTISELRSMEYIASFRKAASPNERAVAHYRLLRSPFGTLVDGGFPTAGGKP